VPSTPTTKARWLEIKKHKLGEQWYEGDCLYIRGKQGVTVYDLRRFGEKDCDKLTQVETLESVFGQSDNIV
jgi:hypothetical protein